ncbi:MAG: DUF2461 domain-containing protein [Muribaculaceae bacterium]
MATTNDLFKYLKRLQANNNRDWFQENKSEYDELRAMWIYDVDRLINRMAEYDNTLRGIKAKDCIYRIYRDVRFSNDKTPYKPYFSAAICREGRKCTESAYYIHLQPGESGLHGGIWCPEPKLLNALRHSIDDNIEEFINIIQDTNFKNFYTLAGNSLKTMPKGFPREHQYSQYIRMKEFLLEHYCSDDYFTSGDWIDHVANDFKIMQPFHQFMNYTVQEMQE